MSPYLQGVIQDRNAQIARLVVQLANAELATMIAVEEAAAWKAKYEALRDEEPRDGHR